MEAVAEATKPSDALKAEVSKRYSSLASQQAAGGDLARVLVEIFTLAALEKATKTWETDASKIASELVVESLLESLGRSPQV